MLLRGTRITFAALNIIMHYHVFSVSVEVRYSDEKNLAGISIDKITHDREIPTNKKLIKNTLSLSFEGV